MAQKSGFKEKSKLFDGEVVYENFEERFICCHFLTIMCQKNVNSFSFLIQTRLKRKLVVFGDDTWFFVRNFCYID